MQPRLHPNIDAWKDIYHGWLVKIEEWRTADSTKTGEIVEIIIEPEEVKSHLRTAIKLASPGFADLIFPMGFSPDLHIVAILKSIYFLPKTGVDLEIVHRKTLRFYTSSQGTTRRRAYQILFSIDNKYAGFQILPDSYATRCESEVGVFDLTPDDPQLIWGRKVDCYGELARNTFALHPSITYIAWSCHERGTRMADFLDPQTEGSLSSLLNPRLTIDPGLVAP